MVLYLFTDSHYVSPTTLGNLKWREKKGVSECTDKTECIWHGSMMYCTFLHVHH